jgi:hypothetical protein
VTGYVPITVAGVGSRELAAITLFAIFYPSVTDLSVFVITIFGFLITSIIPGLVGFVLSLTEIKANFLKMEEP